MQDKADVIRDSVHFYLRLRVTFGKSRDTSLFTTVYVHFDFSPKIFALCTRMNGKGQLQPNAT